MQAGTIIVVVHTGDSRAIEKRTRMIHKPTMRRAAAVTTIFVVWLSAGVVATAAQGRVVATAAQGGDVAAATAARPPAAIWRMVFARPSQIPSPVYNPLTREKAVLGKHLFSDTRLSGDQQRSCATCHDPRANFVDNRPRALGRDGHSLPRNTPQLWNLAWAKRLFWDGRATSLEDQARFPIVHKNELGGDLVRIATLLNADKAMKHHFDRVFLKQKRATPIVILKALASYQRTLVSPPTRFDNWIAGKTAKNTTLNNREYAGFRLFVGRGGCLACHGGWRFTDDRFHDIGLKTSDLGRNGLPPATLGMTVRTTPSHKTPSLRNIAHTAPYMHDGSLPTLEDIVAHYVTKRIARPSLAPQLRRRITLSKTEQVNLIAFLKTL